MDQYGYLENLEDWNQNFAQGMAEKLGIESQLTQQHWDFINYLRDNYFNHKTIKVVIIACDENGLKIDEFKRLFPAGYHRGACKIAGINYQAMYAANFGLCSYEKTPDVKTRYKLTPMGFLSDFNNWDECFVNLMRGNQTNKLNGRHWDIIFFLRDFYQENHKIPTIHETCNHNGISFEEMHTLFPEGYHRGACRLAGLPFYL